MRNSKNLNLSHLLGLSCLLNLFRFSSLSRSRRQKTCRTQKTRWTRSKSLLLFLKPVAGLLWFGMTLTLLVSCGNSKEGPPEITFAAALLPSEQTKYVGILKSFTEKTGIPVKLVAQQYAEIRTTLEAEAKAGRGELDVTELDVYLLLFTKPLMQPLDSLLETRDELQAQVQKEAWEAGIFEDKKIFSMFPIA